MDRRGLEMLYRIIGTNATQTGNRTLLSRFQNLSSGTKYQGFHRGLSDLLISDMKVRERGYAVKEV